MRKLLLSSAIATLLLSSHVTVASTTANQPEHFINDAILPPVIAWQGKSEALLKSANDQWATPFEQRNYMDSPNYQQTMDWLDKLVSSSDKLHKISIGKSPQGRDIWMIVASKTGAADAKTLKQNKKATVLVQAGIHSGEIDGKDAGMMLLRDIAHGNKHALLDNVNLLFVPIFSVDAHERSGEFNRVNQRGPINMGWRTTATNLNLNRDYAKADALEMQHMIRTINQWQPDLYIDVHVTDGIDYQYDVTFGYNLKQGYSPSSFKWLDNTYRPEVEQALTQQGHIPGPLVFAMDNTDLSKGMSLWNPSPRYSNGYGDARHLPTILIENHSLKPYKQRVLGTYVLLEQTLKTIAKNSDSLIAAVKQDQTRQPKNVVLSWQEEVQKQTWDFKGIGYSLELSPISGVNTVRWNGKPKLYKNLPVIGNTKADITVSRPDAYYVPAEWTEVINRLSLHGIQQQVLAKPLTLKVEQYQMGDPSFMAQDYEGRQMVSAPITTKTLTTTLPAGTIKIPTAQALGDLAIVLLEPQAEDSLFKWGFFNTRFTQTEYIEDYAVEPMAAQMLAKDPALKQAFETALKDEAFAKDSKARLRWFYQRSPYFDAQFKVYPVLRGIK